MARHIASVCRPEPVQRWELPAPVPRCDACGHAAGHNPHCPELVDALAVQERDRDCEDLDDDDDGVP